MDRLILVYFEQHTITENNIRFKFPATVGIISAFYAFLIPMVSTLLMKTRSLFDLTIAHTDTVFFT